MNRRDPSHAGTVKGANVLVLLGGVFFAFPQSADPQTDSLETRIELKSSVDKSEVPFNREATFTVQASWEGEQDRFDIAPVGLPECENFEILGSSSVNETRVEEGKTVSLKTFKFSLRPTQTGTGRIGSVQLSYVDRATQDSSALSTQPIDVQVTAPVEERGPVPRNILIFVVAAILIYVIYSARRRTRRIEIATEETKRPIPEHESPEDKTLKDLEAISHRVQQGDLETFPSDIYRLLTGYLEARHQIVTAGKTSDDIVDSLSNLDMPSERIDLLRSLFAACDLIKYAKDRAEKEKCREIAKQAREFVEQNR
ncbi:MAG: BatD family protein [Candidatus Zixiibacteriota bacterium]|nr:MAG: BatD family protein [candidate division Zixibacteria bacterium]